MRFEQSLQLVDARVALPYWDFTLEEALSRAQPSSSSSSESSSSSSSSSSSLDEASAASFLLGTELFSAGVFGAAGLGDRAGAPVADGRWAYASVRAGAWNTTHNSFGYLRAPWNNNPTPFVTRSATQCGADSSKSQPWPSCEAHLFSLANVTTFSDWALLEDSASNGSNRIDRGGI